MQVFEKSGSWIVYNNEKLGQGREKVRQYLRENKKVLNTIEKEVMQKYKEKEELLAANK